jgi:hypothetical protein
MEKKPDVDFWHSSKETMVASTLINELLHDKLIFRPTPLFDESNQNVNTLILPQQTI